MSLFRTLKMLNVRFPHFLLSALDVQKTCINRKRKGNRITTEGGSYYE